MKTLFLCTIRLYQKYISPDTGLPHKFFPWLRVCRFTPSCSEYSYQAIKKYGTIKGTVLGFKRILRCNPFNPGGLDPLI